MRLKNQQRDWDDLAHLDPYWAILSQFDVDSNQSSQDAFFATGQRQVEAVLENASRLGHAIPGESALDFGCGVGRLTRALATHFAHVDGVDISEQMIADARRLNRDYPNCTFTVNTSDNLRLFPDASFDMIYSVIVLQHLPDRQLIAAYLSEFMRTLKPGGLLVFQLPTDLAPRYRRQLRMRLYSLLRGLGVNREFLYRRAHLYPIRMNFIPQETVVKLLEAAGATVEEIQLDTLAPPHPSCTYYVTKHVSG